MRIERTPYALRVRRRAVLGRVFLLLGALVLLVGGVGGAFVLPRLDAIHTLLRFAEGGGGEDGVLDAGMAWVKNVDRTGFERLLVATPEGEGPFPALVFVHGVAVKGLDDGRIIRAVDAFRDAGFVVIAPEVRVLVNPPQNDHDLERVAALLHAVALGNFPTADARRVGVIGISVGGGMSLRAVARYRAEGGAGPRAILAIGAPDDLKRIIPTWFGLPRPDFDAPRTAERVRREEARFARNVVLRASLGKRVASTADRAVLRAWLEENLDPMTAPDGLETKAGRAFAALATGTPEGWRREREAITRDAWPLMAVFSPAASGPELGTLTGIPTFLLHGTGDPLVPVTEMDRLAERLRAHTMVVTLASHMIGHVDVETTGITEQLEHVVFMDDFFDIVRR